jgi:hypothetical protein
VRPDEVGNLLRLDGIDLDGRRHTIVGGIPLAQSRCAALVPDRGEQDRDGKAEPLDVAVEVREELFLLARR